MLSLLSTMESLKARLAEEYARASPEPGARARTPGPETLQLPLTERPVSLHSERSTGSGRHRHALLKSDISGQHPIERDLPIPAILTTELGDIMSSVKYDKPALKNITVPRRRSSITNLMGHSDEMPTIGPSPQPSRVCIDPRFHPPGTHAYIHHRGLVKGGDFCDAGLPVNRESPIRSPETFSSKSTSSGNVMLGRIRRVLTSGDVCDEIVDVSQHIHRNHPASVKVRPALGLQYSEETHDVRRGVSKVRPANGLNGKEVLYDSDIIELKTTQEPTPRLVRWSPTDQPREIREPPKETSYWEFFPISPEKKDEHVGLLEKSDTNIPPRSRQSSVSVKSVGVRSSKRKKTESSTGQENLHQEKPRTTPPTKPSASPISSPISSDDEEYPSKARLLPGKLGTRRTARWLRRILGHTDTETTKLTSLPEKSHPRREPHEDYHELPSTARERTVESSSDEPADVMNSAMENLENILSEAIRIADDVTSRHVEESNLSSPPRQITKVTSHAQSPPSVHESVRSSSTDESQDTTVVHPIAFLGAVECPTHGCESLPVRSLIRRGLTAPNMHSGNIRGPTFPPRISSLRHTHKLSNMCLKDHGTSQRGFAKINRVNDSTSEEYTPHQDYDALTGHFREVNTWSLDGGSSDDVIDFSSSQNNKGDKSNKTTPSFRTTPRSRAQYMSTKGTGPSQQQDAGKQMHELRHISLRNKSHVSLQAGTKFSLTKSVKRQPIARD